MQIFNKDAGVQNNHFISYCVHVHFFPHFFALSFSVSIRVSLFFPGSAQCNERPVPVFFLLCTQTIWTSHETTSNMQMLEPCQCKVSYVLKHAAFVTIFWWFSVFSFLSGNSIIHPDMRLIKCQWWRPFLCTILNNGQSFMCIERSKMREKIEKHRLSRIANRREKKRYSTQKVLRNNHMHSARNNATV